jgi:hypothetical protein
VVLRTYDHARFIAQAIESVLIQQAPFSFELVIGEDCSTDGTREIVEDYARRHPGTIRTILPGRNLGHDEIFLLALEATRGDFIAYLDGDDYWTSADKLAEQVAYLEKNQDCACCFHDVSLIYDDAGLPSGAVSPEFGEERFTLEQVVMECFVPSPAMMFRRKVADRLAGWISGSAWIHWMIQVRAAQAGPIGYLPGVLAAYRVHRGGIFSGRDRVSQLEEDLKFYEKLAPELSEQGDLIERCVAIRHAQLAIERLGVPFDACVVLVDPRREHRPYFNGRHARSLPRREGHEVTELEAIREAAAALPTAVRDYGPREEDPGGSHACYVVIPLGTADWLEGLPQLSRYLEQRGQVVWNDDGVLVHELEPVAEKDRKGSTPGARRRVDFTMSDHDDEIAGGYLDAPTNGALLPAHAVAVVGWVVGREHHATAMEFRAGGRLIWRAPVGVVRPDIVEEFPDLSVRAPGFETTLNVDRLPEDARVEISAVLADDSVHSFAELRFSR